MPRKRRVIDTDGGVQWKHSERKRRVKLRSEKEGERRKGRVRKKRPLGKGKGSE